MSSGADRTLRRKAPSGYDTGLGEKALRLIDPAVDTHRPTTADGHGLLEGSPLQDHLRHVSPAELVTKVYDAVEADEYEVIGDELTAQVKAALSGPVEALYPELRDIRTPPAAVEE